MGSDGQKVSCGDTVDVTLASGGKLSVGICQITKKSNSFHLEGFLPGNPDIFVKCPVDIAKRTKVVVTRTEKATLENARRSQFNVAMENSSRSSVYRKEFRQQQIGCFLRQQVFSALNSKAATTRVCLGLSFLETDLNVFNLNPFSKTRVVYSYNLGNLGDLDCLLGSRWDILIRDDRVSFVTQVIVSLSKDCTMKASISTAVSWGPLSRDYRKDLQKTMLTAGFK